MKPLNDYSFIRGVCHGLRGEENWDRDFEAELQPYLAQLQGV